MYIGPSEAISTRLGFPFRNRETFVIRLQVHLPPEQHLAFYREHEIQHDNNLTKTTLTEYLKLTKQDPLARTLFYADVQRYYVLNNKIWERRRRGNRVGLHPEIYEAEVQCRVYTVSSNSGDLYYFRLLLHNVKGPASFKELQTVRYFLYSKMRAEI